MRGESDVDSLYFFQLIQLDTLKATVMFLSLDSLHVLSFYKWLLLLILIFKIV